MKNFHPSTNYERLLIALLLFALASCSHSSTTPERKQEPFSLPIEEFELTERSGKKVRNADLRGKVWIASFVFTRCTGTCKQITATMERLQGELANEKDVRLVTFTVDPAHDDPAELHKYAERHHADKSRWLFLTGEEKEIHRLLKESFKVPVARSEKGKPGDEYDHSTRLVVVDRQGNVRGYYQGIADESSSGDGVEGELKKLKEKVAALLREP